MLRRTLFVSLIAALALLLGGCGESAEDKKTEKTVAEALAAQGKEGKVEVDGDKVKIETSDGTEVEAGTGEIPDGFPIKEVPLVGGEIEAAAKLGGQGYQVVIADGDFGAAVELLEKAGMSDEGSAFGEGTARLTGNGYSVLLTSAEVDGKNQLVYAVSAG
jgi:hypothetical protein